MPRSRTSVVAASAVRLAGAFVASLALAAPAVAAPISVSNFEGFWTNWQGGNVVATGVVDAPLNGLDTIEWGSNTTADPRTSGYTFKPADATALTVGTPFLLGTFTHDNNEIWSGTAIDSVDYQLSFSFTGLPPIIQLTLEFAHDETSNDPALCPSEPSATACADIVTTSVPVLNMLLTDNDGNPFFFNLLGFSQSGSATSQFVSPEFGDNTAGLYAVLTRDAQPVPAPEPATLVLLGSGLAAAAAARRRRQVR